MAVFLAGAAIAASKGESKLWGGIAALLITAILVTLGFVFYAYSWR